MMKKLPNIIAVAILLAVVSAIATHEVLRSRQLKASEGRGRAIEAMSPQERMRASTEDAAQAGRDADDRMDAAMKAGAAGAALGLLVGAIFLRGRNPDGPKIPM